MSRSETFFIADFFYTFPNPFETEYKNEYKNRRRMAITL